MPGIRTSKNLPKLRAIKMEQAKLENKTASIGSPYTIRNIDEKF